MKRIDNEAWLLQVQSPDCRIAIERFGLSRVYLGWGVQDRVVHEHYLTYVVDQSNATIIDDRIVPLPPGSALYFAPGVPHTLRPLDPQKPHSFYHLRFETLVDKKPIRPMHDRVLIRNAGHLRRFFEEMFNEHHAPAAYSELRFRAILTAVFSGLFRAAEQDATEQQTLNALQQTELMRILQGDKALRLAPSDLAAALGYSVDYFTLSDFKLFCRFFGEK